MSKKLNVINHDAIRDRPSTSNSIGIRSPPSPQRPITPSSPILLDTSYHTPSSPEQSSRRTAASLSPRQVGLQFRGSTPNSERKRLNALLAGTKDWPSPPKRAGTAPAGLSEEVDESKTSSITNSKVFEDDPSKLQPISKYLSEFKSTTQKPPTKEKPSSPIILTSPIITSSLEGTLSSRLQKSILRKSPTKTVNENREENNIERSIDNDRNKMFTTKKFTARTIKFDDTIQYNDNKNNDTSLDLMNRFNNESSIFDKMTIENLVEYFTIASLEDKNEHSKFIHVTSRHNIENVKKRDFYDMVLLEKPGLPKTGYVWNRLNSTQKTALDHDKIMQLSMDGLLIGAEREAGASELISLPQLMSDRCIFYKIRSKSFFGYFAELKYFTAWRRLVRHDRIKRVKSFMNEKTFFSSLPLVIIYINIITASNQLENDIDLFAFSGSDKINIIDYFRLQSDRFEVAMNMIKKKIENLSKIFLDQYKILVGETYIQQKMQDLKEHHPYQHAEEAGLDVNWFEVRSVKRVKDDAIEKIENLLWMAQFAIEVSIARILNHFWRRMKQFVSGIERVKEAMHKGVIGYWPVENSIRVSCQVDEFADWEEDQGIEISDIKQKLGKYLSIDVAISSIDVDIPTNMIEFLKFDDPKKLKVTVFPLKKDLIQASHNLLGSLGKLLDSIPNLRKHLIVRDHRATVREVDASEVTVEDGLTNEASSIYFLKLHFCPILASDGALDGAFDFINRMYSAYSQASSVFHSISSLNVILEKLVSIHPETIAKQLDRSLILPKIREILEMNDTMDDFKNSIMRDMARLQTLKDTIHGLQDIQEKLKKYPDLLHRIGTITSFKKVCRQLDEYVSQQIIQLLLKLPPSFSTRCRQFIEYIKTFEKTLDFEGKNTADQIELLRKLQNYESAFISFQSEGEVCESMYSHILECEEFIDQFQTNQDKIFTTIRGLIKDSSTLYAMYRETQTKLAAGVSKAKTFLLGRVTQIKTEVLLQRRKLHERITMITDSLMDPGVTSSESIPAEAMNILRKCGTEVDILKTEVNSIMSTQNVLLRGHDVIGAANMIFAPSEIDNFPDMQKLDRLFMDRNKAWGSIVDCSAIKRNIVVSSLGTVDVKDCYERFKRIILDSIYLEEKANASGSLTLLKSSIAEIQTKVDLATCLSSSYLRPRHWNWLSDNVLVFCGLLLKFAGQQSDIITATDVSGQDVIALGSILKLSFSDLIYRGIESYLEKIKYVAAEAVVEGLLEKIIHLIEEMIHDFNFEVSTDWLQDFRLREKISFDLSRVINFRHLNVIIQYCNKAIQIVKYTAIDMNITVFDKKFLSVEEVLFQIEIFLDNYRECQFMWYYVLYYVKFPIVGELDRDTVRLYQSITDDCKRIESIIQQRSKNILLSDNNILNEDISIANVRTNLVSILDAEHASIQSLLDACPRLSLLSYRRIRQLNKAFKLGPVQQIKFVNNCIHELFDGVGTLSYVFHNVRREYYCTGFLSYDCIERITFEEGISFVQAMPSFINTFEIQMKNYLIKNSDTCTIYRIKALQSLLTDSNSDVIIENIGSVFSQRVLQIHLLASDSCPNQLLTLFNYAWFVEDVWSCLGYITGCLKTARSDLEEDSQKFGNSWRKLLQEFSIKIKANIKAQHDIEIEGKYVNHLKMKVKKASALSSSLLLQEIGFLRIIDDLLKLNCLESANEYWASRYQIRFIYSKENRVTESPFDVCIGCITVPYGLEYYGAHLKFVPNEHFDHTLLRVLSSSISSRGTLLVRNNKNSSNLSTDKTVSVRDVAIALGRIHTALTSVNHMNSVKLFLSRLLYLEAVGCVDFENITQGGLQILVSGLQNFWSSLKKKQDTVFIDSLKYPIKTSFSRTELVIARRRENASILRHKIDSQMNEKKYCGLMLVGLASETSYVDINVYNYFCRSCFDVIVSNGYMPIRDFGSYLATAGFAYANEISKLYETTLLKILQVYKWSDIMVSVLGSFRVLRLLASKCSNLLHLQDKPTISVCGGYIRYVIELECFAEVLWEYIALNFDNEEIGSKQFQRDLFLYLQQSIDPLTPQGVEKFTFESIITSSNGVILSPHISNSIKECAIKLGLIGDFKFLKQCARGWEILSSPSSSIIILSGNSSCGKTSVRKVIINTLNKLKANSEYVMTDSKRLKTWHAAQIIFRFILSLKNKKDSKVRDTIFAGMKEKQKYSNPKTNKNQEDFPFDKTKGIGSAPKEETNVTVIYTNSLPTTYLLGSFDSNGYWNDGLLIRTIRRHDTEDEIFGGLVFKLHYIVLDGPIGFNIEQLFSFSYFQSSQVSVPMDDKNNSVLCFPSGEAHSLSENVKIIIETDDLSNASPAFISSLPHHHVIVPSSLCITRLITVWIRSIENWLHNFPPWLDLLQMLKRLLLVSPFVSEIVSYDHPKCDISNSLALSRVSSFLRYLEELLTQCQDIVFSQSSFTNPESDEESDDDVSSNCVEKCDSETINFATNVMIINSKTKEMLVMRVYLSIIYATTWGFGGLANSSNQRIYFDSLVRDLLYTHLPDSSIVDLLPGCCLFDAILNLEEGTLSEAVYTDINVSRDMIADNISQRIQESNISVELGTYINGIHEGELLFRTTSLRALESAIRILLYSEANLLLIGEKGSGKSRIISEILRQLKENTIKPDKMKEDVGEKLIDIMTSEAVPEGIATCLKTLQNVLSSLKVGPTAHDDGATFEKSWDIVRVGLKDLWAGGARSHMISKSVFSSSTSVLTKTDATSLRFWLESQFRSEVKHVLETPRLTYGMIFIDDMNILDHSTDKKTENLIEGLLKGYLDDFPSFGILRVKGMDKGKFGLKNGQMYREVSSSPIVHIESNTDPKLQSHLATDNYIIQRMGTICAATGDQALLIKSKAFESFLRHFGILFTPSTTLEQVHDGVITASFHCINLGSPLSKILDVLRQEILELSNFTMSVINKLTLLSEELIGTPNFSLVSRLIVPLINGCKGVANPGGLIQLYLHEWRRNFLDPVPNGIMKEKIRSVLKAELDNIDVRRWYVSMEWLTNISNQLDSSLDRVWADPELFTDMTQDSSKNYRPLELDGNLMSSLFKTQEFPLLLEELKDRNSCTSYTLKSFNNGRFSSCLVYPGAVSMVLRIVRLFSLKKRYILLSGFVGSARFSALNLAATICKLTLRSYDVKEVGDPGLESAPSRTASISCDIKAYIKNVILKIAGIVEVIQDRDYTNIGGYNNHVSYSQTNPERTLMVFNGVQSLSKASRQILVDLIEHNDPTGLFNDQEMLAIAGLLRKVAEGANSEKKQKWSKESSEAIHAVNSRLAERMGVKVAIDANISEETNEIKEEIDPNSAEIDALAANTHIHDHCQHISGTCSGYIFHWVKSYLSDMIISNLIIAFNQDVPLVMKLKPAKVAKKAEDENEDEDTTNSKGKVSSLDNKKRCFSLLAPKIQVEVDKDKIPISESKIDVDDEEMSDIYKCPILSSTLKYRFYSLYWTVDNAEAVSGICNFFLRNENKDNVLYLSSLTVVGIELQKIGIYDDPEEERRQRERDQLGDDDPKKVKIPLKVPDKVVSANLETSKSTRKAQMVLELDSLNYCYQYSSILHTIGIFKSFNCFAIDHSFVNNTDIEHQFQAYVEQARVILPYLLTLKSPIEAGFLTEPIICFSVERNAEIAATLVMSMLKEGSTVICKRLSILKSVKERSYEAFNTLRTIPQLKNQVKKLVDDLQSLIKHIRDDIEDIDKELDSMDHIFRRTPKYENYLFMQEDYNSTLECASYRLSYIENAIGRHRKNIYDVNTAEWNTLATAYDSKAKPSKEHVDLMRGIMILINFTPKVAKANKVDKMDDTAICRHGATLLRSINFAAQLATVNPVNLSNVQINAIHILNNHFLTKQGLGEGSIGLTIPDVPRESTDLEGNKLLLEIFRRYLLMIESYYNNMHRNVTVQNAAISLASTCKDIEEQSKIELDLYEGDLKAKRSSLVDNCSILNHELLENKSKLITLDKLAEFSGPFEAALHDLQNYIETESTQLEYINEVFVADCCVAATVLTTAGWLHEEVRQHFMEHCRAQLLNKGIKVSNTPFVLGNVFDRLQCRLWSCPSKKNLPRDPSSLNTLSLVNLSPMYTFIVDPDGIAESALANTVPEGYQTCISSAQKFSFELLKSWLNVAYDVDHTDPSLYIIVTDLQSGVSEDLITFLSAELVIEESAVETKDSSANSTNCNSKFNFYAKFDPSIAFNVTNNSMSLCRIRLHLISSRGMTMNSKGISDPLPVCCLKNVMIVYWSTSIEKSYYVESKPFNIIARKQYVSNEVLCHRMCSSLSSIISPDCQKQFENISQDIFQVVDNIYDNQNDVIMKIYDWICNERNKTLQQFVIEGIISQEPIPLGIPAVDYLNKLIVTSHSEKRSLLLELDIKMKIENELLTYQGVLAETFSMSIDFLRTCGVVIPKNVFPPNGLSTRVICSKFIEPALKKAVNEKLFLGVPESLYEMNKLSKNFAKVQQAIRGKLSTHTIRKLKNQKQVRRKSVQVDNTSNFLKLMRNSRKVSGLDLNVRKKSANELQFLLIPFRNFILREAIDYVLSSIRPGLAWLVKFSCLIASWTKASIVPEDELRALLILINASYGHQYDRYSFYNNYDLKSLSMNKIVPPVDISITMRPKDNNDNKIKKLMELQRNHILRWMQYGLGPVNGLKINKNSPRWCLESDQLNRDDNSDRVLESIIRTSTVISDIPNSNIISKELNTNTNTDDFEFLWLQSMGVKTFTIEGSAAANSAFGSANVFGSFDDNHRDREITLPTTVTKGRKKPSSKMSSKASTLRRSSSIFSNYKRFSSSNNTRDSHRCSISPQLRSNRNTNRFSHLSTIEDVNNTNNLQVILKMNKEKNEKTSSITSITSLKLLSTTEDSLISSSRGRMFSMLSEVKASESSRALIRSTNQSIASLAPKTSNSNPKKSDVIATNPFLSGTGGIKKNDLKVKEEDPFNSLITNKESLKNFNILESHPNFAPIFGGMRAAIVINIEVFLVWKEKLNKMLIIDLTEINEFELEDIILSIIPPGFVYDIDNDDPDNGLWVNGHELTIIQSMLISEVIVPGSSGRIAESMFALIAAYLGRGGHILSYSDDDRINIDDDYDEKEDEVDKILLQDTSIFNCWTKLRKVLQYDRDHCMMERKIPTHTVCRDFENWEGALYSLLIKEVDIDRTLTNKNLRLCLQGSKSTLFLTQYANMSSPNIALFTECARNLSTHNDFQLTLISNQMRPSTVSEKEVSEWGHNIFNENSKLIKLATNLSGGNKLLFELLDISSPLGNAIISANFNIKKEKSRNYSEDELEYYSTLGITVQRRKEKEKDRDRGVRGAQGNIDSKLSFAQQAPLDSSVSFTQLKHHNSLSTISAVGHMAHLAHNHTHTTTTTNTSTSTKRPPQNRNVKSLPLIGAVSWNHDSSKGPCMFVCDQPFKWFPRLYLPDIISSSSSLMAIVQYPEALELPPSSYETVGILMEEFDVNLMWVMLNTRNISDCSIPSELRNQLRQAKKMEVRTVAAVISMWRLVLYLNGTVTEVSSSSSTPTPWSTVLEPMSIWHFARLMIKTINILQTPWLDVLSKANSDNDILNAEDLCKDPTFINAMHLLADSFLTTVDKKMPSKNANANNTTTTVENLVVTSVSQETSNSPRKARATKDRRRDKKKTKIDVAVETVATLYHMRSSNRFHNNHFSNVSNTSTNINTNQDFRITFINLIGLFFADLISYWQSDDDNTIRHNNTFDSEYVKISDIKNRDMIRRETTRLNFRTYLKPKEESHKEFIEFKDEINDDWLPITNNCDLFIGGLDSDTILQTLLKWVLDGASKPKNKTVEITRVMKKVRNALQFHGKRLKE